nr:DMT family transporter [Methylonatrum kenyense]
MPAGNGADAARWRSGVVLTLLGVIAFSSKGVFAKLAYPHGVEPAAFMLMRMSLAIPLFWLLLLWRGEPVTEDWRPRVDGWRLLWAGLVGYYVAQLLDLIALQTVSATLGRLIVFTYPCFIVILLALLGRRWLEGRVVVLLAFSYGGLALALVGGGMEELRATWSGVLMMLASAALFATYYVIAGDLGRKLGTRRFSARVMTIATIGIAAHYVLLHPLDALWGQPWIVYGLALAMAVVATVLPLILIVEGMRRVGTETSAVLNLAGPGFTFILAWVLLGEQLRPLQWLGFAIVLLGAWQLSGRRVARQDN